MTSLKDHKVNVGKIDSTRLIMLSDSRVDRLLFETDTLMSFQSKH